MRIDVYLLVTFIALSVSVSADHEPGHTQEIDYTDTQQVNALSTAEIFTAMNNGQLTNLAILNDNKLTELVTYSDPEKSLDGSQSFLQENNPLFAEVDKRAAQHISFLNDRPDVLNLWFQKFGIQTSGPVFLPQLTKYDGKVVTTDGYDTTNIFRSPTTFDIRDLSHYLKENGLRAWVRETGALQIEDMSIYQKEGHPKGGPIELRWQGNLLEVHRGIVDLSPDRFKFSISVRLTAGSSLSVEEYQYQSPREFFLTTTESGVYTVTGDHIRITKDVNQWQAVFKGRLEHRVNALFTIDFLLHSGSTFTEYAREERDHSEVFVPLYTVSTQRPLSLAKEICSVGESCLYLSPLYRNEPSRKLTLTITDHNQVEVGLPSPLLKFIAVNPISDDSSVAIVRGKQGVRLSQNGQLYSLGASDLRLLPEIRAFRSEQEFTLLKRGLINECNSEVCEGIASAKGAGRRGKVVHVAAARLDGQQAVMEAARRNGLAFTGYEAVNIEFQNVQEDLATAEVIALSGHHVVSDEDLWGESGTFNINNDLPASENVKAVTFSACNTIKDPHLVTDDPVLPTLTGKYSNLRIVLGYNTKAPLYDSRVWAKLTPMVQRALGTNNFNEIKQFVSQPQTGIVGIGEQGPQKLGLYVRENDQWKFCVPREGCKDIAPAVAVVAPAGGASG